MQPFTTLTAVAAPLPLANVDTDKIIPARFLKTIKRTGLGQHLFDTLRFEPDGSERADFVLNQPAYREAGVLIAHENFGCGSSREHAPWALLDFGIRCVIAPSFADIFAGNAFKNGILTVALPQAAVDRLLEVAETDPIAIDLEHQTVTTPFQDRFEFEIDPFRKQCLTGGLDEVAITLASEAAIAGYEAQMRNTRPWLARGTGLAA